MNKQSLINLKYLYLGWYLYPVFSLVLSFVLVINYTLMINIPMFEKINIYTEFTTLTPFFILLLGFSFQFHFIHLLWNKKKEQSKICSTCNRPAKYFRKNEFHCTNPTCTVDLILKEDKID